MPSLPFAACLRGSAFLAFLLLAVDASNLPAQPVLAAAEAELPGGIRLHYVSGGPREARTVVLLHGYPDSHFSWARVAPTLARHLRVVAPDLRGHGRSSRPTRGYAVEDLAEDVLALLDELGIDEAIVVGHSMGSFVAQRLADVAPDRLDALVLVGGAPSIHGLSDLGELVSAVEALADPVPEEFLRGFQESTIVRPLPAEFFEGLVAESRLVPARVLKQVLRGMLAAEPRDAGAGSRELRTWLLWGTEDPLFDSADQDALLRLFTRAELRAYEGVGHAPHWEDPDAFAADIAAIAAALDRAGG